MGASRRALLAAAALAATLAACDALLGLNDYQNVACAFPADCPEAGTEGGNEASPPDASEGGVDAEASTADSPLDSLDTVPEGGFPLPYAHEIWVHWRMPNPDAAIAPDFPDAGTLPNQMVYDAGATTVHDLVTSGPDGGGLTWWRESFQATTYDDPGTGAWEQCYGRLGPGWRVPTRIELISLVDFTQPSGSPTIDLAAFPDTQNAWYWTSSPVPAETGTVSTWTVSFQTGLASYYNPGNYVRCVTGGATQ